MREIVKMIVVLSLISGLSGLVLAYLKVNTADQIEVQVLTFVQGPALKNVFAEFDNDPIAERKRFDTESGPLTVFPVKQGGQLVGLAFEAQAGGFGGDIGVIVGFDVGKDTLHGIGITTHKETPGLGSRVAEPKFTRQFRGHSMESIALAKNGGDIDGVSGATFSSIGSVDAVNKAVKIYAAMKDQMVKAF